MKLARLLVDDTFLAALLRGEIGAPVITDAPSDLRIHGILPQEGQPWTLRLIVESESFAEVAPGAPLPEVVFRYTRRDV